MAVKLRLKRMGAKKRPHYRIVAADARSSRDGSFIEIVGYYHPLLTKDNISLDEEKVLKWLNNGAQPTDTVKSLFVSVGLWNKFKVAKPKAKKAKATPKAEEAPTKEVKKAPVKPATAKTVPAKKPATRAKKSEK